MHHTVLWNVYIHDFLFSGRVIIIDAVPVDIRSYLVSPINVLGTFFPRKTLVTHTVIGPVLTTRCGEKRDLPITFRIDAVGFGTWWRTANWRPTWEGWLICWFFGWCGSVRVGQTCVVIVSPLTRQSRTTSIWIVITSIPHLDVLIRRWQWTTWNSRGISN